MSARRPAVCVCDCPYDFHLHLRAGSDCGSCGPAECPAYRGQGWRAALTRLLLNVFYEPEAATWPPPAAGVLLWTPAAEPLSDAPERPAPELAWLHPRLREVDPPR